MKFEDLKGLIKEAMQEVKEERSLDRELEGDLFQMGLGHEMQRWLDKEAAMVLRSVRDDIKNLGIPLHMFKHFHNYNNKFGNNASALLRAIVTGEFPSREEAHGMGTRLTTQDHQALRVLLEGSGLLGAGEDAAAAVQGLISNFNRIYGDLGEDPRVQKSLGRRARKAGPRDGSRYRGD